MRDLVCGFVILCGLFQFGSSIMCYECNSATNSLCVEPVLPDNLRRNCSEHNKGVTHTLCRKIIQHVDFPVKGHYPESRVIRTCGWDETRFKGICYHRSGYGGRQEVCSCTKDFCNGGHTISTTILSTIIIMLVGSSVSMIKFIF